MRGYRCLITGLAACITAGFLTGCGETVPDLSDEQQTQVTEYAVGTLLKYSQYSNSRLTGGALEKQEEASGEPAFEEQEAVEEPVPEEEQPWLKEPEPEEEEPVEEELLYSTVSMEDYMGLQGVSLSYTGYQFTDAYPADSVNSYFSMTASEGKKLLVLEFKMENTGSDPVAVDLNRVDVNFSYSDNGGQKYKLQHTMVENDIYGFSGSLEPGESRMIAGIVEMPAAEAGNISVPVLTMTKGDEKETILLK